MIDFMQFTQRALSALALGTAIGVERQFRQCTTGLRTNALVSVGSCLFVMSAFLLSNPDGAIRIASYVVSGIGFVGAGTIMKDGTKVRGLSTATTLWGSASLGVLCGIGFPEHAFIGVLVILFANIVLKKIANSINTYIFHKQTTQILVNDNGESKDETPVTSDEEITYEIAILCRKREEGRIRRLVLILLSELPLMLRSLHSSLDENDPNKINVYADLTSCTPQQLQLEKIVALVSMEKGVSAISWNLNSSGSED